MKKSGKLMRMKALLLTAILSIGVLGSAMSVSAASVSTKEFGTFTYSLTRDGRTVKAITKVKKRAPKLITKLEVQLKSTGKTIYKTQVIKNKAKYNKVANVTSASSKKLAVFSTHEARGNGSIAKYRAISF